MSVASIIALVVSAGSLTLTALSVRDARRAGRDLAQARILISQRRPW